MQLLLYFITLFYNAIIFTLGLFYFEKFASSYFFLSTLLLVLCIINFSFFSWLHFIRPQKGLTALGLSTSILWALFIFCGYLDYTPWWEFIIISFLIIVSLLLIKKISPEKTRINRKFVWTLAIPPLLLGLYVSGTLLFH